MKNIPLLLLIVCNYSAFSQTNIEQDVLLNDSLFWTAYNDCDIEGMKKFIADDVEFYHDRGGIQKGIGEFAAVAKKNLCSNNDFHLKREAVPGSIKVFPMQDDGKTYGAIMSGEHVFYILETGKEERLDGLAKFTHLWILKDGNWKMSRILSYDHGPAPYRNKRKEISVSRNTLDQYAGTYKGPQTGDMRVLVKDNLLHLIIGDKTFILHPESSDKFFVVERDLQFQFEKNAKGGVQKMTVIEKGNTAETAERVIPD